MLQTAAKEGITARELADRNAAVFRDMGRALNASNDDFVRTTEARHHATCQEIWRRMEANGDIYLSSYAGWYSGARRGLFRGERNTGRGRRRAPGADRRACGVGGGGELFLPPQRLPGSPPALYESQPDFIRRGAPQTKSRASCVPGLKDLSVSRTAFEWGIPVPGNDRHVMYCVVDALTQLRHRDRLSGCGGAARAVLAGRRAHHRKDIVRFHTVYWPAFLLSAGWPLPRSVFGHGFLFNRGEKMSKSVGNVIDPFTARRPLRRRPAALLPIARSAVRPGRQLLARGHRGADQRRFWPTISATWRNARCPWWPRTLAGIVPAPGALTPADEAILAAARALPERARAAMADWRCTRCWPKSGRWWRRPTATSPPSSPGWSARPTRPASARCCSSPWRCCASSGSWSSRSCRRRAARFSICWAWGRRPRLRGRRDRALQPGTPLPAPAPIFPRYVEDETPGAGPLGPCRPTIPTLAFTAMIVDSHCHLDFPTSPPNSTGCRARACGGGREPC